MIASPRILTLTTDFGTDGPYVAAMKGVVLGLVPDARIVDVSHAITPQNIEEAAFVLGSVVEAFPGGTVHLAVVDPGVGTARRLVAVGALGHWFVAPDNGLIGGVLGDSAADEIWVIANPALRRPRVSSTFHGRDILAPAAAHLLLGGDPADLGPLLDAIERPRREPPAATGGRIVGRIVFRDRFGNLITDIPESALAGAEAGPGDWLAAVAGREVRGLSRTYGESPPGTLVALVGSSGRVEVAVVNGDAAATLGLRPGDCVTLRRPDRNT